MNIRIATTVKDGKLKMMKVHTCSVCPNGVDQFHSEQTHSPGQIKSRFCELFDLDMPAYAHVIHKGCGLPSLLDVSSEAVKPSGVLPFLPPLTYPAKRAFQFKDGEADCPEAEEAEPTQGHSEEDLKEIPRGLLGDIGNLTAITLFLMPHLKQIAGYLKKSAQADLILAILECERFLDAVPEEGERGNRVVEYLDEAIESLSRLKKGDSAAEPEEAEQEAQIPEDIAIREVLKDLAGNNVTFDHNVYRLYLAPPEFARLIDAAEKAGADVGYWRGVVESYQSEETD